MNAAPSAIQELMITSVATVTTSAWLHTWFKVQTVVTVVYKKASHANMPLFIPKHDMLCMQVLFEARSHDWNAPTMLYLGCYSLELLDFRGAGLTRCYEPSSGINISKYLWKHLATTRSWWMKQCLESVRTAQPHTNQAEQGFCQGQDQSYMLPQYLWPIAWKLNLRNWWL